MVLWIVADSEIVGFSDSEDVALPQGYSIVEGPDKPREQLYVSNGEILEKPPKPHPEANWDGDEWIVPAPPTIEPVSDWNRFVDAIPADILATIAQSPLASLITARMAVLYLNSVEWDGANDRLISAWNAAPPALNQGQRDSLLAGAVAFNIPLTISETNMLGVD